MLDHCFIEHIESDGSMTLHVFQTHDELMAALGAFAAEYFESDPKEIIDHLDQFGHHYEGDLGVTYPNVDGKFLAVTQPDCVELDKPIVKALKPNLATLIRAAKNDDLCLLECRLESTGETVAAICAAGVSDHGDDFTQLSPFGVMLCGNPYEMVIPPETDDRDGDQEGA